jgi:hypothetical protein
LNNHAGSAFTGSVTGSFTASLIVGLGFTEDVTVVFLAGFLVGALAMFLHFQS